MNSYDGCISSKQEKQVNELMLEIHNNQVAWLCQDFLLAGSESHVASLWFPDGLSHTNGVICVFFLIFTCLFLLGDPMKGCLQASNYSNQ